MSNVGSPQIKKISIDKDKKTKQQLKKKKKLSAEQEWTLIGMACKKRKLSTGERVGGTTTTNTNNKKKLANTFFLIQTMYVTNKSAIKLFHLAHNHYHFFFFSPKLFFLVFAIETKNINEKIKNCQGK